MDNLPKNSEVSADKIRDLTMPNDNRPYCTITTASLPGREAFIKDIRKKQNKSALLGFIVCLIPLIAIALFIFIPWYYALAITLLSIAVVAYFIFTIK